MKNRKAVDILLVDDDEGDVMLTEESLREGKIKVDLHAVHDGISALQFLRQEGIYAQAVRPDMILLDLNMPKMNGRETLKAIKSDERFCNIPIVVLTTSEDEFDISNCYALGANCYVTKPVDFEAFKKVVHSLEEFWFTVVKTPSKR